MAAVQLSYMERCLIATVQLRKCIRPAALERLRSQYPTAAPAAFASVPQQRSRSGTATNQLAPGTTPNTTANNILSHTRSLHHSTPPPVVRQRRQPFTPTREQIILGTVPGLWKQSKAQEDLSQATQGAGGRE